MPADALRCPTCGGSLHPKVLEIITRGIAFDADPEEVTRDVLSSLSGAGEEPHDGNQGLDDWVAAVPPGQQLTPEEIEALLWRGPSGEQPQPGALQTALPKLRSWLAASRKGTDRA